ncbi:hypothetical protein [Tabrizicola sp. BL-A-41-H6]
MMMIGIGIPMIQASMPFMMSSPSCGGLAAGGLCVLPALQRATV